MPEQIENPMVIDSLWDDWVTKGEPPDGYYSKYGDRFVPEDEALEYAFDQITDDDYQRGCFIEAVIDEITVNDGLQKKFLDWFFRNWNKQ